MGINVFVLTATCVTMFLTYMVFKAGLKLSQMIYNSAARSEIGRPICKNIAISYIRLKK